MTDSPTTAAARPFRVRAVLEMCASRVNSIHRLAPTQEGLLFEALRSPESGLHVEQFLLPLRDGIQLDVFIDAWSDLVQRHASLRTGFFWQDTAQPVQLVFANAKLPVRRVELAVANTSAVHDRLAPLLEEDRSESFQLERPPLMRLTIARQGAETWCLWTTHHLILDGWCMPILLDEIGQIYRARLAGTKEDLPEARPFSEYVSWLGGHEPTSSKPYWETVFSGSPSGQVFGQPVAQTRESGTLRAELSADVTQRLTAAARDHRVTMSTLVHGAWALLLAERAASNDVVFGTTVSGRPDTFAGIASMVGPFVRTLPIRVAVPESGGMWSWLSRLQSEIVELNHHQFTSPADIHRWSGLPGTKALFDTVIVVQNYPQSLPAATDPTFPIEVDSIEFFGGRTRFPLTLMAAIRERLHLQLNYDRELFATGDIERIRDRLVEYLHAMLDSAAPTMNSVWAGADAHRTDAGSGDRPSSTEAPVLAPEDPMEAAVASVWEVVLGEPPRSVDQSFVESGGHSLLAMQFGALLKERFGVELPLAELIEGPTIASLAKRIRALVERGHVDSESLPSIEPDPSGRFDPFPLTDVQQAYWTGRRSDLELGSTSAHLYLEIEAQALDLQRFSAAWNTLIKRHDMLRAVVSPDGLQRVLPDTPEYRIEVIDLRNLEASQAEERLASVREEMATQIFAAGDWPLFEIRASLLDGENIRLHVSYDMLICDAWSFDILSRELAVLYERPNAPLPVLELTFRDYVLAKKKMRESEAYKRSLAYWRKRIENLSGPPALPLAPVSGNPTHRRFCRRSFKLDAERWGRLKGWARQSGLTPTVVLLTAFAEVLAHWSAVAKFVINLTLFQRVPLHSQVNEIIGDFTSLILLEVDLTEQLPFSDRATWLNRQLLQDLSHRIVSGVEVLRELTRSRANMSGAAMPVVFTSALSLGEGEADRHMFTQDAIVHSVGQTPQVWLDSQVSEHAGELHCTWDVLEEAFPAGLVDDMFAAMSSLVESIADQEEAWSSPALVPASVVSFRRRVARLNSTEAPSLQQRLDDLFDCSAKRSPDAIAVISDEKTLTYGELAGLANDHASRLCDRGAHANSLVAIHMPSCWQQSVAALSVIKSGAAYLPIDPQIPDARLRYLVEVGEVELVLTESQPEQRFDGIAGLKRIVVSETTGTAAAGPSGLRQPEDLAYVIYTSGSTGNPKGVMIDHHGAVNTVTDINRRFGVGPADRVLALSALGFDLSVYDLFGMLAAGGAVVLPPATPNPEPSDWLASMHRHGVTIWNSVPAMMEMLLDYVDDTGQRLPDSLRLVLLSGDWIPTSLPDRIRARASEPTIVSLGGATEASIWSIAYPIEEVSPSWSSIPYGRALANQQVYVLNDRLEVPPPGTRGEIFISGMGLAKGYWRNDRQTEAAFGRHPVSGKRMYRTGDIGCYWPNGDIELLGREDAQVKIRGHRIELGEIEANLRRHPQVRDAVASTETQPDRSQRLVGCVVLQPQRPGGDENQPAASDLSEYLSDQLPGYMVPARYVFLEELPLTSNGKVDRRQIDRVIAQHSDSALVSLQARTATEDLLAQLWMAALGVESVDGDIRFFELGGDSLTAIRLQSRIRSSFGVELPLRSFFEVSTLREQARLIRQLSDADSPPFPEVPAAAIDGRDPQPLSFVQHRLWFLHQIDGDDPSYNVPGALRLRGDLDVKALARALTEIVDRHEVLRSIFEVDGPQPKVRLRDPTPVDLPMDVIDAPSPEARMRAALSVVQREVLRPFHFDQGILARFRLLRLDPLDHILTFNIHHIVCDAWSLGIFATELACLYNAFVSSKQPPSRPLQHQYVDFSHWQRALLDQGVLEPQLAYWRRRLEDVPHASTPARTARAADTRVGETRSVALGQHIAAALRELAARCGCTLFMVLLAVFKARLMAVTGRTDILVGTSVAGRTRAEFEGLIGCFVNLLPLRTRVEGDVSFLDLLEHVRETVLDMTLNQDVPFDRLVEMVNPQRAAGAQTPMFETLFVFDSASPEMPAMTGLEVGPVPTGFSPARYPLNVHISTVGDDLLVDLHFRAQDCDVADIEELLTEYPLAIEYCTADPAVRIGELAELLDRQRRLRHEQRQRQRRQGANRDLRQTSRRPLS